MEDALQDSYEKIKRRRLWESRESKPERDQKKGNKHE